MNIDFNELYKKLLEFWNKYDGVEIDNDLLRSAFNAYEIACIFYDRLFDNVNYSVISTFKDKVRFKNLFFTSEEAESLVQMYPYDYFHFFKFCSDEFLFSFIVNNDEDKMEDALRFIKSDEYLLKAFMTLKSPCLRAEALSAVKDSNIKMKHLWRLPSYYKSSVIMSLDDDYLIEKYITLFRGEKGRLIMALDDDKKKAKYLKRFFPILSKDERADIIRTFKDDEMVLYYLRFVGDYAKGEAIKYRFRDKPEIVEQLITTIKNKSVLADLLKYRYVDNEYVERYIDRITNQEDLEDIICNLDDDDLVLKFFPKISYKRRLEKVKEYDHPKMRFKLLKHITKIKDIISVVEHTDRWPEYSDDYSYLIDIYANEYKVDRGRLEALIKNVSMAVLAYIENENIIKILNAKEDEFILLMRIFNKNDLAMDQSAMNDILNAMLQRQFRMSAADIILIFPVTLNAIDSQDRATIEKNVEVLCGVMDVAGELKEYDWTIEKFIDALMNKNETAIDFLHVLTAKYIRRERSAYVQENLAAAQEKTTDVYCDKNDLMRFIINTYPVDYIMTYFAYYPRDYEAGRISEAEKDFLNNKELIRKIIMFKKNPRTFGSMPEDVRNNLKIFNTLFEKRTSRTHIGSFSDYKGKKTVELRGVDSEFLANILMYVDVDKLRINFFNNPELIEKFMKFWKQYKLGGWGDTFNSVLSSAGVIVDPEIVANFVQYFGLSYEQLEEKKEKKEIASISLTALLDLAACYSVGSKKYSLLFGEEDFRLLSSNPGPNSSTWSKDRRMSRAVDLVKTIRNRDYVTVPPIDKDFELDNGKKMNVVVGNFSNMMNLTYGERTGACMRIGGAGKSLFDFCLEEDSGFHVRFVNPDTGKFVSRVSGFRNGNTVFLNELRYSVDSTFSNKDVVLACKAVARELIEQSKGSSLPIDNVVITPYYAMKESGMMAKNLGIKDPQKGMKKFYTDVSENSVILATSAPNNELVTPKLGVNAPKYDVLRDKKRIFYNREAFSHVAHLQCLDQVMSGRKIEDVDVEINEDIIVCYAGEDWCVTIDKQGKISEFLMKNSNSKDLAIKEMQEALIYLKENLSKEMNIANNVLGM